MEIERKGCKNSKRNKLSRIEKENKMKYSIKFNTISRKVIQEIKLNTQENERK